MTLIRTLLLLATVLATLASPLFSQMLGGGYGHGTEVSWPIPAVFADNGNGNGNGNGNDNGDGGADLEARNLDDSDDPVNVGDEVAFRVEVENHGPRKSDQGRLIFKFDPSWGFVLANDDCTFQSAASLGKPLSRVRCQLGEMEDDEKKSRTAVMRAGASGTFTSVARAKNTDAAHPDPDLSNNDSTERTTVR
jgi:hypothetical protein